MEVILNREIIVSRAACRVFTAVVFIVLTALGAFVRIPLPFTPVPLTLQTFFVLLSGAFLGKKLGALTQLSYVSLGIAGLPVFTDAGSGLLYLSGPTGGYIVGFVLAALLTGRCVGYAKESFLATLAVFCLADLALLACGVIWLKFILGVSSRQALFLGFIPFLAGDLLKALAACVIYLRLKPRLKEIF